MLLRAHGVMWWEVSVVPNALGNETHVQSSSVVRGKVLPVQHMKAYRGSAVVAPHS